MPNYIIEAKNIHKSYRLNKNTIKVLTAVDIAVESGSWLTLLGASGSGKTTLLNILGTLEKPDSGSLFFDGVNYNTMNTRNFRTNHLGFVFQTYHLLPELNVLENVMLPARLAGNNNSRKHAEYLIERVGLSRRGNHRPGELSGGECQRAAIARSLINSPKLLLADEPTGNLDSSTGNEIMALFKELHTNLEHSLSIIMITHNPALSEFGNRVCRLSDGTISNQEGKQ